MGYEIWDRYEGALVADFDDEGEALHFLREMVRALTVEVAARKLDRLQLVHVTDNGETTEVVSAGVELFGRTFAPAVAR